jgi:ABC-type glycerol-3-phosphate transport system substrate-binding protein
MIAPAAIGLIREPLCPPLIDGRHQTGGLPMKSTIKAALAGAALLALAACGGNADDQAADNVEAAAEAQADNLEAQADMAPNETMEEALEQQADNVEEAGEAKADAIDDADDARMENATR